MTGPTRASIRPAACATVVSLIAQLARVAVAHAGTPVDRPEAIEVDRDATPPGQAELGFDGGAPIGAWAVGVELAGLVRPMRYHTIAIESYPVERRETATLGGALAVGDSVIVDARLPMAHQIGDRSRALADPTPLDHWVLGDLGFGARLRVADHPGLGVFLRGQLTLPTGDDRDYAGEARWTAAWLGIVRATLGHGVVVAGTGGIRLRGAEVKVADQLVGDELVWGAGATVELPPIAGLWCKPEQFKLAADIVGVVGDHVAHQHSPSPAEAQLGVIGRIRPELALAVRIGVRLDDQVGAPVFRGLVELVFQASPGSPTSPRARSGDRDGDTIDDLDPL
jgi:hypothetical protein